MKVPNTGEDRNRGGEAKKEWIGRNEVGILKGEELVRINVS